MTSGCETFHFGWENESAIKVEHKEGDAEIEGLDGPSGGKFDEEGNWIPNNPEIPATYKIPDISAGFLFDIAPFRHHGSDKWKGMAIPALQVELFEFDSHIPYVRTLKFDLGVGYQRGYVYLGKLWTNIFEISTGGFVGWNWEENELSYGVGATIIKF